MIRIPLAGGYVALIDDRDAILATFRWWPQKIRGNVYARRDLPDGSKQFLHRAVLEVAKTIRVDHRNGNGLDCRRRNLRRATNAQNLWNRGKQRNNTSGFKGVSRTRSGKWRATISANGRWMHLGVFKRPEQAARAYDAAARKQHGRFAALNSSARKRRN